MVLDYPDWSRVASGSLRYLGSITQVGAGQTIANFAVQPADRSLVFFPTGNAGQSMEAQTVGHSSNVLVQPCFWGSQSAVLSAAPMSIVISALVDPTWDITFSVTGSAGTAILYVFASTDLPPMLNAGVPTPIMLSDGQGIRQGQQPSLYSLPVVEPSDAPGQPYAWRRPYSSMLTSAPTTNTKASVVFPATVGQRWVVDFVNMILWNNAAAAGAPTTQILDGVTAVYQSLCIIPAVISAIDRDRIGPGAGIAGSIGAAVTVGFGSAAGVNTIERVTAGAYLLPAGL